MRTIEKNFVEIWTDIQDEINELENEQREVERKIEDWIKKNFSYLYECLGVDVPRYITIDMDNLPDSFGAFLYYNGKEIDKLFIPSVYVGKTLIPSEAVECSEFLLSPKNKKKIINFMNKAE